LGGKAVILEPVNEPFEFNPGAKLAWVFGSSAIGFIAFAIVLSWCNYSTEALEKQRNKVKPEPDDVVDMMKFLIPKDPHFMTAVILDINIIVMIVMVIGGVRLIDPNGIELMEWGALRRAEVLDGQWWRLITSMFIHAGLLHLFFNIYGLWLASTFLEPTAKRWKYLTIYMISGIVAGIASIVWSVSPGVGASGAIFGLFGALLGSLATGYYERESRNAIFSLFGPYVGINLAIGFFIPGIGNAAHIGGLITGFLLGLLFFWNRSVHEIEDAVDE
jgi:rhomboid protease GluP